MSITSRKDKLLQKAVDGEAMSDEELREFGAALVADADLCEEFALMRRIGEDAARLPLREPSADFSERVMTATLRVAPPGPAAESAPWVRQTLIGLGALIFLGALWGARLATEWALGAAPEGAIRGWASACWEWMGEVMSEWDGLAPPDFSDGLALWLAAGALVVVVGLNLFSARAGSH